MSDYFVAVGAHGNYIIYETMCSRHDEMLAQTADAAGSQGCEIYLHLIASPHHYLQLRCGAL